MPPPSCYATTKTYQSIRMSSHTHCSVLQPNSKTGSQISVHLSELSTIILFIYLP